MGGNKGGLPMTSISRACRSALALATLAGALCGALPAIAQSPAYMNCGELWYARNEIYAQNGYCFETARARAAFGPGCFPPFGQLSRGERATVNEIQAWERRKGC